MKIEVLFPEIANLYGDLENITYLKKSCPEIEVIETNLNDEPYFANETPDLIYMGTMTERAQELIIEKLMPYKERLVELIENGANFLITGNAIEIFGNVIEDKDGKVLSCLGIFPINTKRNMMKRYNSLYLGNYGEIDIVGYMSQFTHAYRAKSAMLDFEPMFVTKRGAGLNPDTNEEGIQKNNFWGTYIIGPILVLNPPLAKLLLEKIGAGDFMPAFYEDAMHAYNERVKEYSNPNTGFIY